MPGRAGHNPDGRRNNPPERRNNPRPAARAPGHPLREELRARGLVEPASSLPITPDGTTFQMAQDTAWLDGGHYAGGRCWFASTKEGALWDGHGSSTSSATRRQCSTGAA